MSRGYLRPPPFPFLPRAVFIPLLFIPPSHSSPLPAHGKLASPAGGRGQLPGPPVLFPRLHVGEGVTLPRGPASRVRSNSSHQPGAQQATQLGPGGGQPSLVTQPAHTQNTIQQHSSGYATSWGKRLSKVDAETAEQHSFPYRANSAKRCCNKVTILCGLHLD
jgi:hypothetical protein